MNEVMSCIKIKLVFLNKLRPFRISRSGTAVNFINAWPKNVFFALEFLKMCWKN